MGGFREQGIFRRHLVYSFHLQAQHHSLQKSGLKGSLFCTALTLSDSQEPYPVMNGEATGNFAFVRWAIQTQRQFCLRTGIPSYFSSAIILTQIFFWQSLCVIHNHIQLRLDPNNPQQPGIKHSFKQTVPLNSSTVLVILIVEYVIAGWDLQQLCAIT